MLNRNFSRIFNHRSIVAGTQYRGAFEERLQAIMEETRKSQGQVLLFVDELHMLLSAGQVEGGLTAANLLKPALARGEVGGGCMSLLARQAACSHNPQDLQRCPPALG